jgi:hypothetical protein
VILRAPLGRLSAPLPQKFNTPKGIFGADEGCDRHFLSRGNRRNDDGDRKNHIII